MPLTPVHGLSVLFLYFKNKRGVDPLALVASATIVDLEPLYYVLSGEFLNHHMIWHGYAFALTVYPILISLAIYAVERLFEKQLWSTYTALRLKPEKVRYSLLSVYLCCLIGGFSHIFFDMFTHENMPYVLYPLVSGNPFYLGQASGIVELTVIALAFYSVYCWVKNAKLP
jgi:hypothetical protein